ncbi:MAG: YbgC/FadM family acyl-CoA thioesterase [Candidatus Omnitrophica bacterium]|nr:YbgC/FadM family acyl-CoA thioesterase [Candidatus Omnitrophota bacterium]
MEKKIYYHDTDSGGVVYYANYLKYLEEARTEWLEDKGLGMKSFLDRGLLYAVRSCNVTYKRPARYGDVICCDAVLEKVTGAQLFFRQRVWDKDSGHDLVEAEVVLVCLGNNFKPRAIPDDLKEKLA